MSEINTREVTENDYKFIHDLLHETWYKEEKQDDNISYAMAEIDLNHILNRSTFGLIAEKDEKNLGFILAKVNEEKPVLRQLQSDPYRSLESITNASPANYVEDLAFLLREQEINEEMKKEAPTTFDAEICLFIVSKKARGLGVGSQLYEKVIEYFKKHSVNHYYLFTDDDCNFQFYERKQMHRSQTHLFNKNGAPEESSFNYYLYENSLK